MADSARVRVLPRANGARIALRSDALLLDREGRYEAAPAVDLRGRGTVLNERSRVSSIEDEALFYLASRGIARGQAMRLILEGFFEPLAGLLPLEFSVEFHRLLEMELSRE